MGIGTRLIACPSCSCHAFARETVCPNCGATLRAADGSLPRTAGAMMLGLTLATVSVNGCSDDPKTPNSGGNGGIGGNGGVMEGSTAISAYGIASTSSSPQGGMGGVGGMGGMSGVGGAGGTGACALTCADAVQNNTPLCGSASLASQQLYAAFRECACSRGAADPMPGCKEVCTDNWCSGADFSANCTMCLKDGACSTEFATCSGEL